MKELILSFFIFLSFVNISYSQNTFKVQTLDSDTKEVLSGVTVRLDLSSNGAQSDSSGFAAVRKVPDGENKFLFSIVGYQNTEIEVKFPVIDTSRIFQVYLKPKALSTEEVTVTSLRSNSRIEDLAVKVEVLGYEDINEENGIQPGNISSLLSDISGIQLQQTSISSGEQNLKMLGLNGKYTQILRDGLPQYEGLASGLGILQISPLDLKQVEIVKGASPILYGGGAIAGIINLISKEPSNNRELVFTLNRTSLTESNLNGYFSEKQGKTGLTFFAAYNTQKSSDTDNDGFSDSPDFENYYIHPRLFIYPDETSKLIIGYSNFFENRIGGDMIAIGNHNDSLHTYFERNKSYRNTADFTYHKVLNENKVFELKSTASLFRRRFEMRDFILDGNQFLTYSEASYAVTSAVHSTVLGLNFLSEDYHALESGNKYINDFSNYTWGAFIQDEWVLGERFSAESGLRVDYNDKYRLFVLPQLSFLYKASKELSFRLGGGSGYKIPGIFSEQLEDNELKKLLPLSDAVKAERSLGLNFDFKYEYKFDDELTATFDQAAYFTKISDPVYADSLSGGYEIIHNHSGFVETRGLETYLRLRADELELYMGYNYTKSALPLTPENKAAAIMIYEIEGLCRFGLEASYIGKQTLEDNSEKPGYWIAAAMIAGNYKFLEFVFNCENLFNTKQSKYEKLVTGTPNNPIFRTLWAPVEGRVFNLSVKITI